MSAALGGFAHRLAAVVGSALVLQFYSEFYFMNEGPASQAARGPSALPEMVELTLWYVLFTYLFLIVIDRFEVRSLAGLVLAGSIFGWATEGLVVPVVYEAPPVSFIWPSLSWHALVDVCVGWYLVRLAMRRLAWPWLVVMFAGLGALWAYWASWTWAGDESVVYSAAAFQSIVVMTTVAWGLGTICADLGARVPFRASRWEIGAVLLVAGGLFAITGVIYLPWPVALALLAAVSLLALARARQGAHGGAHGGAPRAGHGPDRLAPLTQPPRPAAYVAMVAMPVAALLAYPQVLRHELAIPAEDTIAALLVLGGLAYVWALFAAYREGRAT